MKSLLISVLSLAIVIGAWQLFSSYSDRELDKIIYSFDHTVMTSIEEDRWAKAFDAFQTQYDVWHAYKKKALYFLDTKEINDADNQFARTLMYIKAKDLSNSSGELLSLREQLKFLKTNEEMSVENIL